MIVHRRSLAESDTSRGQVDEPWALASASLPTRWGDFKICCFDSPPGDADHFALIRGDLGDGEEVLVRLHSACVSGDILGSLRCDCGMQLEASLKAISECERGLMLYMTKHEGRGIGLFKKLLAYNLQESGADTVDANQSIGVPVDARDYHRAADILGRFGVRSVLLLTNNPAKVDGLRAGGIAVLERIGLPSMPTAENRLYLETKRDRLGHDMSWLGPQQLRVPARQQATRSELRVASDELWPEQPEDAAGNRRW